MKLCSLDGLCVGRRECRQDCRHKQAFPLGRFCLCIACGSRSVATALGDKALDSKLPHVFFETAGCHGELKATARLEAGLADLFGEGYIALQARTLRICALGTRCDPSLWCRCAKIALQGALPICGACRPGEPPAPCWERLLGRDHVCNECFSFRTDFVAAPSDARARVAIQMLG